jgi:hypothetical protein
MPRYFVHDLETEKLHIFTGGKADWLTIPEADRNAIKRACLWSNQRGCWVSRCKGSKVRILAHFYPGDVLSRNGFEDRGEVGQRLTFAEKVEATQEKAEARADRMEDRAMNAKDEAQSHFKASNDIVSMIPMGQPILVGHHSEKRHRRALERSDNHMRNGCNALEKAEHYKRRAEAARGTADGAQYSDPRYLGKRIKECEAEERLILRWLDKGDFSEEYREERLRDVREKLGFYRHCLETCGVTIFTKETLKGKTAVKIRGRWEPIVRLNPTTVAVPNICFPTEESQRKWALKYAYTEVQDAR